MKIAIHQKNKGFSTKWIEYCKNNQVRYKIVNCYDSDIMAQVEDCDALMWHFHHTNPKDVLFAKQLVYSLHVAGIKVFPDFYTAWHFDDKVGQKYLLEAIGAPMVPTYVFYDVQEALKWTEKNSFPKVFKLRKGSGSAHVKLVEDEVTAKKLIRKAFNRGFSLYNKITNLKDRWYNYKNGRTDIWNVTKGVLRLGKKPEFAKIMGNERGYVYFQDFMPNNGFDIRVIIISGKAIAIKRLVRSGDFRASGSGHCVYGRKHFDEQIISLSFEVAEKIKSQCLALDIILSEGKPYIVEMSYGFPYRNFIEGCPGYWDYDLNWHKEPFDAQGWMVELILEEISSDFEHVT